LRVPRRCEEKELELEAKDMEIHPSQRRISCELCRKNKVKCQRMEPTDEKCVRCTLANLRCDSGQQKKVGRPKRGSPAFAPVVNDAAVTRRRQKPGVSTINIFKDQNPLCLRKPASFSNICGTSIQKHVDLSRLPQQYFCYGFTEMVKTARPLDISKQTTYYVHDNKFSSDPGQAAFSDIGINASEAVSRITSITHGLQLRSTIVQRNKSKLDLDLLIYREGPLAIGSRSLAEYLLSTAQELLQIVASLVNAALDQQHTDALISAVMDVYCRILIFFELFLEYLTGRAERHAVTGPMAPITGITFNGVVITKCHVQGALICTTVFHLLGRLEDALGLNLNTVNAGIGLLSPNQIQELYQKLDADVDLVSGRGMMRPADVRKLYGQVAVVLERLSDS